MTRRDVSSLFGDPYADTAGVPVTESRKMVNAVMAAGAPHNSWDTAYGEEELPKWLFAQQLK